MDETWPHFTHEAALPGFELMSVHLPPISSFSLTVQPPSKKASRELGKPRHTHSPLLQQRSALACHLRTEVEYCLYRFFLPKWSKTRLHFTDSMQICWVAPEPEVALLKWLKECSLAKVCCCKFPKQSLCL